MVQRHVQTPVCLCLLSSAAACRKGLQGPPAHCSALFKLGECLHWHQPTLNTTAAVRCRCNAAMSCLPNTPLMCAMQVQQSQGISDFLSCCEDLVEPLNAYFDKVFVMTEDEAMRQSRLALLRDVASLPSGILSLAELPGF